MTTQSPEINEIAAAMVAVQASLGPAIKGKKNLFFKSNYADLSEVWEACRDAFQDNGVAVIQGARLIDGKACMETKLLHTSGQWLSSLWEMMPAKSDPQSMGSAITYMRRYSLQAMVGILSEDDDGNSASRSPAKMEQNRQKADNTAAKHVGNYVDEFSLPRNEQEWEEWAAGFKKAIDGCSSDGQINNLVIAATKTIQGSKKNAPKVFEDVQDHVKGRREILATPDRELTELSGG